MELRGDRVHLPNSEQTPIPSTGQVKGKWEHGWRGLICSGELIARAQHRREFVMIKENPIAVKYAELLTTTGIDIGDVTDGNLRKKPLADLLSSYQIFHFSLAS